MFNAYFATERIMWEKTWVWGLSTFFITQYIDSNKNIFNHVTNLGNSLPMVDWVIHIQPFQRVTKVKRLKD